MTEKMGKELIDEVREQPTLDAFMRRDPKGMTDPEWPVLVEALRADRARFIAAEEKKEEKKDA